MSKGMLALAALASACGTGGRDGGMVAGAVFRSADTVHFAAAAWATRCMGSRDVLLEGSAPDGGGALLWLRPGDSLASGGYAYLSRGDTAAPRGAIAGVRYVVGDIARGLTLDSGAAEVTVRGGRIGARMDGSGLDPTTAARTRVEVRFSDVGPPRDSAPCDPAI